MTKAAIGFIAVLLVSVLACSDTVILEFETCSADLAVSGGSIPVFSWSPACGVAALEVRRIQDDSMVWGIFDPNRGFGSGDILPPVSYGQIPTGIHQNMSPTALVAGEEYSIWIGSPAGQFFLSTRVIVGSATFTFSP